MGRCGPSSRRFNQSPPHPTPGHTNHPAIVQVVLQHVLRFLLFRRVDARRFAVTAFLAGAVAGAAVTRGHGQGVKAGSGWRPDEGGFGVTSEQASAVLDAGQFLS